MNTQNPSTDDLFYMDKAIQLAKSAGKQSEVPVGAVLVSGNKIVCDSANNREKSQIPFGHAEFLAISEYCQSQGSWRLPYTTLYVTLEPCLMCTGLIYQTRISRVVFGAKSPKGGLLQHAEDHRIELGLNHSVDILGGVMEDPCSELLQDFFHSKRSPV